MIVSALAAVVMFAAPEAVQGAPDAPAAAPKPEMRRVCTSMELPGTKLPKKTCRMVPVKDDEKVASKGEKTDAPKTE